MTRYMLSWTKHCRTHIPTDFPVEGVSASAQDGCIHLRKAIESELAHRDYNLILKNAMTERLVHRHLGHSLFITLILLSATAASSTVAHCEALQTVTISYPNGGFNWPLYIAKDGGYYAQYGLDVKLVFSPYPTGIAMVIRGEADLAHYSLEQLLLASSKDASLALVSSLINRGMFALMAWDDIRILADLKGKRVGIGQLGDANYSYVAALLSHVSAKPRDVEWIATGPSVAARSAALTSHKIDAAILTAPAYFSVESPHIRVLINFGDRPDIAVSSAFVARRDRLRKRPELFRDIIAAHAAAIKRFYNDESFAVTSFVKYNSTTSLADARRLYKLYASPGAFERVPYILARVIDLTIAQEQDPILSKELLSHSYRAAIDNDIIDNIVKEGFFERLFGSEIDREVSRKRSLAFRPTPVVPRESRK